MKSLRDILKFILPGFAMETKNILKRLGDESLRTADKIKQFADEYPDSLPYLEEVIEVFMNEYKKASAKVTSK